MKLARSRLRSEVARLLAQFRGVLLVGPRQVGKTTLAGKRQVKAPKIYFRDSGLLHTLMGVRSQAELLHHPRLGASWEGFALEQVLRLARPDAAYFWAAHTGAELDLLMFKHAKRVGVEFKHADAPTLTPSMRIALADLELDALYVVYPGDRRYRLAESVEVVPLPQFAAAP